MVRRAGGEAREERRRAGRIRSWELSSCCSLSELRHGSSGVLSRAGWQGREASVDQIIQREAEVVSTEVDGVEAVGEIPMIHHHHIPAKDRTVLQEALKHIKMDGDQVFGREHWQAVLQGIWLETEEAEARSGIPPRNHSPRLQQGAAGPIRADPARAPVRGTKVQALDPQVEDRHES